MIHSYYCKNFYSFGELTNVNFKVSKKAPKDNSYFNTPFGTRLSKVETVVGANASGKTNLLKVLPFMKWLIVDSFNAKPTDVIPVHPFAFNKYKNEPTELSVEFETGGKVYVYDFKLNSKKIISEELKVKSKTKKRVTTKTLFSREWNKGKKGYVFEGKKFKLPTHFENLLRNNASVIGVAMRLNHKQSQEIASYWQAVETNVIEAGWIGDRLLPNYTKQIFETFEFYDKNDVLKEEAEKLMSRFDLGLEGFNVEINRKGNAIQFIKAQAIHNIKGNKLPLAIQYESSGTKQLYVLLKTILQVLLKGGVAVLDEFDVNLHPEIILSLFELFNQPETNPKNAQLLFSTQSHLVLSKLDKYQIIFTEKSKDGLSESWRLDEMSGVRADDNYYAKYISNAYGAVPKVN